jgi:protein-S-isoprenylcysteine O-methyltransferase Ste14
MKSSDDAGALRRLVRLIIYLLIIGVVLFVSYGGVDWIMGWVYMVVTAVSTGIIIFNIGEDLLRERRGKKTGVKKWDIPLAVFVGRLGPLILLVVAGLDKRFGWSPEIPLYVIIAALFVFIFGRCIAFSAMMANKFFSSVVRIQEDRGHGVVSSGPYRYVRHPGYTAIILYSASAAIVLESLWALIPAGLILIVTIIRTALEDRTLRAELEGYADYAGRVRYRLIPLVW